MDSLSQTAAGLSRTLQEAKLPHALGGAIALAFHAPPRATIDIDINVFLDADQLDTLFEILERSGAEIDRREAESQAVERGDFHIRFGGYRVDFFVQFHPFHDSARKRSIQVSLAGMQVPILSAEDLIIFKALFNRPKDWVDIEAIQSIQRARLDEDYLLRWLQEFLPEDDPRIQRLFPSP